MGQRGAMLVLLNDASGDPATYNAWHTREHVIERLGVPGILAARRYEGGDGRWPRYLTLYDLSDLAVLGSGPYRTLLDNPTPWSRIMRERLDNVMRFGCRLPVDGAGLWIGGFVAIRLLDAPVADDLPLPDGIGDMMCCPIDPLVDALPFGEASAPVTAGYVLIVQGYDSGLLEEALVALDPEQSLQPSGEWARYTLRCALDRDAAARLPGWSRPAGTDIAA